MNMIKRGIIFCLIAFIMFDNASPLKNSPRKQKNTRQSNNPQIRGDNEIEALEQALRAFFSTGVKEIGSEFRKSLKSDVFQSEIKKKKQEVEGSAKKAQQKQRTSPSGRRSPFNRPYSPPSRGGAPGYPAGRTGGFGGGRSGRGGFGGGFGGGGQGRFGGNTTSSFPTTSQSPFSSSSSAQTPSSRSPHRGSFESPEGENKETRIDEKDKETYRSSATHDDKDAARYKQLALSTQEDIDKTMNKLIEEMKKKPTHQEIINALPGLQKDIESMKEACRKWSPKKNGGVKTKTDKTIKIYQTFFPVLLKTLPLLAEKTPATAAEKDATNVRFQTVYKELEENIDEQSAKTALTGFEKEFNKDSELGKKYIDAAKDVAKKRFEIMKELVPKLKFDEFEKLIVK